MPLYLHIYCCPYFPLSILKHFYYSLFDLVKLNVLSSIPFALFLVHLIVVLLLVYTSLLLLMLLFRNNYPLLNIFFLTHYSNILNPVNRYQYILLTTLMFPHFHTHLYYILLGFLNLYFLLVLLLL